LKLRPPRFSAGCERWSRSAETGEWDTRSGGWDGPGRASGRPAVRPGTQRHHHHDPVGLSSWHDSNFPLPASEAGSACMMSRVVCRSGLLSMKIAPPKNPVGCAHGADSDLTDSDNTTCVSKPTSKAARVLLSGPADAHDSAADTAPGPARLTRKNVELDLRRVYVLVVRVSRARGRAQE
jgi:hypothetical protein